MMMMLFSSGTLGTHFSYYTGLSAILMSGATSVGIETAHLIYCDVLNDASGSLNVRAGRFLLNAPYTPMFQLLNQNQLVYNATHYEPLAAAKPANTFDLATPVFGVSTYGTLYSIAQGLRWELAYIGGNNSDIDLADAHAFFAALDQTIYENNASIRFGCFILNGVQDVSNGGSATTMVMGQTPIGNGPTMSVPRTDRSKTGPQPMHTGTGGAVNTVVGSWTNTVTRFGVDAEVTDPWTRRFSVFAEYMKGNDDNVDSLGRKVDMLGGFVGLNAILLPEKLYAFGRFDVMKIAATDDVHQTIDAGLRYNILPNAILGAGVTITSEAVHHTLFQDALNDTTTGYRAMILFGF